MKPPKCLVLGKNYAPISIIPKLSVIDGEEAIYMHLENKAQVLYFYDRPILSNNKPIRHKGEILYWPSILVNMKQKIRNSIRVSRDVLYIRERGRCFWCDDPIPHANQSTKDHIIPKSKGGLDTFENLVCSCKECNSLKADSMPIGRWALNGRSPREPSFLELLSLKKDSEITIHDERWIDFLPNFASYKIV